MVTMKSEWVSMLYKAVHWNCLKFVVQKKLQGLNNFIAQCCYGALKNHSIFTVTISCIYYDFQDI